MTLTTHSIVAVSALVLCLGSEAAQACYFNCPPPPRPRMQVFQQKLLPLHPAGRLAQPVWAGGTGRSDDKPAATPLPSKDRQPTPK